jgi:ketosteroid isomerase-like protein
MTSKETVKAMYDAFATGNIPFILDKISEDFTWKDPSNPSIVPFGGEYKGKNGMMNFFQNLGGSADTTLFQVDNYTSEGETVVAQGKHCFQSKKTGKDAELEWTMVWHFKNGMPVAGRAYYNTAASEKAFSEN